MTTLASRVLITQRGLSGSVKYKQESEARSLRQSAKPQKVRARVKFGALLSSVLALESCTKSDLIAVLSFYFEI